MRLGRPSTRSRAGWTMRNLYSQSQRVGLPGSTLLINGPLGCTRIAHGSGIRGGRVDTSCRRGRLSMAEPDTNTPAAAMIFGPGPTRRSMANSDSASFTPKPAGAFTCTQGMLLTSKKGGGAYEVTGDSRLSRSCRYMTHRNTGQGRPDMARRPSVNGWHRKPGRPVTQGPGCTGQGQGGTTHESRE